MTFKMRLLPLLVASLALVATRPTNGERAIVVRADPALAPVLQDAIGSFDGAVVLDVGPLRLDETADVVAGQGPVMTRLLEGGHADLSREVLLPPIRWVLIGGAEALDGVRVPSGELGAAARRALLRLGVRRTAMGPGAEQDLALVPESLAAGRPTTPVDAAPILMSVAPMVTSPRRAEADRFVAHVARALGSREDSLDPEARAQAMAPCTGPLASINAVAVVDWWIPQESLAHNKYNNPQEALGAPNATGTSPNYQGFVSLGSAGYVTVDMGGCVPDGPGPDVRVYQYISGEEVTVYASSSPTGPFSMIGYRISCQRNCDFDLADAETPIAGEVRYLKIEDGELFASNGDGGSNGADLDAVRAMHIAQ